MEWLWAVSLALLSALIYILVRLGTESTTKKKKYIYYGCVFIVGLLAFYVYYKLVCNSSEGSGGSGTPNYLCAYYVLVPVAILLGVWLVYGKRPLMQEVLGVIIIVIGIVILIYKKPSSNPKAKESESNPEAGKEQAL